MKSRTFAVGVWLSFALTAAQVSAQGQTFDIQRFDIQGGQLLPAAELEAIVAPYTGKGRNYGDVQKALEALERAYRARGYGAVNVHVPEQEITSGVVRLVIIEAKLGKVSIEGNAHFDAENIRAALPHLKEGASPNLREISENVQLANENPARRLEVVLATSETEGEIDAKIRVTEEKPQRFFVTLDNTGTKETGRHRLGVAYQDANLAGRDEVLTLAYTGSPDVWLGHPDDVKVDIYSLAFRKPFYGLGDSLDVIYGNSNVNVPSVQATGFGLTGKGEVLALRWNHHFPRRGEYSGRLVFGYDYKHLNTRCKNPVTGSDFSIDPPTPPNASCVPYTVQPVSATYSGQFESLEWQASYQLGLAVNLFPSGTRYTGAAGTVVADKTDHYSFITGRPVSDRFTALRLGGSLARRASGWLLRAAVTGQHAESALPPAEQLGLAGSTAVRGFKERAVATDTGLIANFEAYTPNLAEALGAPGNLHGLAFLDVARGRNVGAGNAALTSESLAAAGVGLRYSLRKDVSFSLDVAQIIEPGPANLTDRRGDWLGHFKLTLGF
ncbi:MAG: hypothetical protein N3C63_04025 [Rhodocyclaceae bacterium]|nr:hypothetical protein [Rhodocyclaceae bacterium]